MTDSAVEMTWRTFTGGDEALYLALLIEKARVDKVNIDKVELNHYFKLHLHRGISYLNSAPTDSIENYVKLAI